MNLKEIKKDHRQRKRTLNREYTSKLRALGSEYSQSRREIKTSLRAAIDEYRVSCGKRPLVDPPKRSVLEEIGNSVSHGLGSVFAIVAFILMLVNSSNPIEYVSASIYFFGQFVMFTMSCLYHAFPHGSTVKRLFRRFDYTSIYLLIGATFAPPLLNVVGGTFGTVFFIIQWSVIVLGITLVAVFGPTRFRRVHIPLYVVLGWSALMLLPTLITKSLPLAMLILAGGVVYSVGIIPYAKKFRASHFIWHIFVLGGCVVQWIGIYAYIFLA